MAYAPPNEDTYHFVTTGAGAAATNGGGCTKAAWNGTLTDFVRANGGDIRNIPGGGTFFTADKSIIATDIGKHVITGDPIIVGTLLYITAGAGGHVTAGVYEITTVVGNDQIKCANIVDDGTNDNTFDIYVGGALDSLQNALDDNSTDATTAGADASPHNRTIFTNLPETGLTLAINPDIGGGDKDTPTYKRIVGFETTIDDGELLTLTGDETADGIDFNAAVENIIFENIKLVDFVDGWSSVTDDGVLGIRLINCQAESCTGDGFELSAGRDFALIDCQANSNGEKGFNFADAATNTSVFLYNCIAHDNGHNGFKLNCRQGATAIGCIAYDNGYAGFYLYSFYSGSYVINCVSYSNDGDGFTFDYFGNVAINCIAKDNGDEGFYFWKHVLNNFPLLLNCCAHGNTTAQFNVADEFKIGCIETDPLFVDAANADFRLKATSPCLHTGKATLGTGGSTSMGAWQRKQYPFRDDQE